MTTPATPDETARHPATWAVWMDVFADITDDFDALPTMSCPRCGARTLRTQFSGAPEIRAASGYLWCDTCLFGIAVSRMGVPDGVEIIPFDRPRDERPPMPDYTLVWPQDDDAEVV
jgi:hypothetical protein